MTRFDPNAPRRWIEHDRFYDVWQVIGMCHFLKSEGVAPSVAGVIAGLLWRISGLERRTQYPGLGLYGLGM